MYLGVAATPTLFFLFTVRITRHDHWLSRLNLILLCVQPLITILMVWGAEHLVFDQITLEWRDGFTVLHFKRGIWFWANIYYSYALILAGYIVLAVSSIRANLIFRRQYLLVLGGSVAPFLFSIYTQLQFSSLHDLDLAPIAFGISGLVYAYAILRFQFMDLVPVARSTLIENMSDGVLVLDAQSRIVDANPAILELLKDTAASILGKNISTIMYGWVEINWVVNQDDATRTELRLQNDPSRYMDLRMTPLFNERHELTGRIIVFRDITDRKKVEKDLVRVNDHLNAQLLEIGTLQSQLREQAIRDALTNVFNRRYLEETLDRELSRAEREGYPLCMIMMDIDHFKDVNDVYGHEAGDVVLKALSEMITLQSRHGDFTCRYGGEEFMLVMPNIGLETTLKRALELHQNIEAFNIPYGRFNLSITISMGVACYPLHGETKEELLRAADKALYQSKHSGRNCVSVYQDHQPTTAPEN
jgi:diguanylate cyclase (GGDEF)-like protein/PAS domain S-box-containing protein